MKITKLSCSFNYSKYFQGQPSYRIGILGGSFNPIHRGHIYLAKTAIAVLNLDQLDLVPCSLPPHKSTVELLPFQFRLDLAYLAAKKLNQEGRCIIVVNDLEGRRPGPSYTIDTLITYRTTKPKSEFFFLLGASDLITLPYWHQGLTLPKLATFVSVPRLKTEVADVIAFVVQTWPYATLISPTSIMPAPINNIIGWYLYAIPQRTVLLFIPLPHINYSSSAVRTAWRTGQNLIPLLPSAVAYRLLERQFEVNSYWGPRLQSPYLDSP